MKRVVIGTFSECKEVIRKSELLGLYDYYELSPTTDEEFERYSANKNWFLDVFYVPMADRKRIKKSDLFTLNVYKS